MKNKTTTIIFKAVALAVSWLTLSPLLLILDGRWKLLPKWLRFVLFVVSPMMVILYFIAIVFAYNGYQNYMRKYHYVRPCVVENIVGVRMPRYKVIERNLGYGEVVTCHVDTFTLEFNKIPDSAFYRKLQDRGFNYQDGCYRIRLIRCFNPEKVELGPGDYILQKKVIISYISFGFVKVNGDSILKL